MTKLALCVGINDYPGTGSDLSGCVNDAMDWAALLTDRGYSTLTILDTAATKQNVLGELRDMVGSLRYRDKFVFTFSGHGTWVPDGDGDEPDGRDEALCMHDVHSGGLVTDDELFQVWQAMRHGVSSAVFSDSCHSGTVARGVASSVPSEKAIPKFLSPGVLPTVPVSEQKAIQVEARIVKANSRPGPVLISGCDDPEYSYDAWFQGRANGAFTRAAIDTLSPDVKSYSTWHKRIRSLLPSPTYPQSPQLGATRYQRYKQPLS